MAATAGIARATRSSRDAEGAAGGAAVGCTTSAAEAVVGGCAGSVGAGGGATRVAGAALTGVTAPGWGPDDAKNAHSAEAVHPAATTRSNFVRTESWLDESFTTGRDPHRHLLRVRGTRRAQDGQTHVN